MARGSVMRRKMMLWRTYSALRVIARIFSVYVCVFQTLFKLTAGIIKNYTHTIGNFNIETENLFIYKGV